MESNTTRTETRNQATLNPHHEPTLRGQYQAAAALEFLGETMEEMYSRGGHDLDTALGGAAILIKLVAADLRRLDEWTEEQQAARNTTATTLEDFDA